MKVDVRRSRCACVCVHVQRGDQGLGGKVVVTKGRFLFLQDVSLSATPLYGTYSYIGKKYSRNREWGRNAGGRTESELQEVGGQRVARWRLCARGRKRTAERTKGRENRGCRVYERACSARASSFFQPRARGDFSIFPGPGTALNFPPRIFGDFVRGRKQKGRRSVKSNSANARRFAIRKHSGLSALWKN